MITDCIFDFYGTLVDVWTEEDQPELWETLAKEFAPEGMIEDPKELRAAYDRLVQREEEQLKPVHPDGCGEISLDKVFAALFPGRSLTAEDPLVWKAGRRFRELSIRRLRLYPGTKEMLQSLRDAGKRVWLLSNAQRIFTAAEIEQLGIGPYFDGIYLSSDHGVKKPSPEFYQVLLREQGLRPEQAVMTGNDGRCDIEGAKALGLTTIYLHTETSPKGDLAEADYCLDGADMKKVTKILLGSK